MLLLFLDSLPRFCVSMVLGGVSRVNVPRLCRCCRRGEDGEGVRVGETLAIRRLTGSRGLLHCEAEVWGEDQEAVRPFATGKPHESWLSVLEILIELGDRPITSLTLRDLGDLSEFLLCLSDTLHGSCLSKYLSSVSHPPPTLTITCLRMTLTNISDLLSPIRYFPSATRRTGNLTGHEHCSRT